MYFDERRILRMQNASEARCGLLWVRLNRSFPLSLDQLIGHIPQTDRATLPGDMEDAYGLNLTTWGTKRS